MTPEEAYYKAYNLGLRIPELESVISKDVCYSYFYTRDVIKGRWELAEPIISKNVQFGFFYARHIIKGRWELGEAAISKNAYYSYIYAIKVIKGRLPDFMHNQMILENNEYTKEYIEFISKNPDSPNNI